MTMRRFAQIAAAFIGIFVSVPTLGQASQVNRPDMASFKDKLGSFAPWLSGERSKPPRNTENS
jgi:hypothetical protein